MVRRQPFCWSAAPSSTVSIVKFGYWLTLLFPIEVNCKSRRWVGDG
jgi:hypothetical protein